MSIRNIEGEYSFTNAETITNKNTKVTLHLRKRKKPSRNKPDYFLSVNKPEYEYISSLYLRPNKRQLEKIQQTKPGTTVTLTNQESVNSLYFDYQNKDYRLIKMSDSAKIEELR